MTAFTQIFLASVEDIQSKFPLYLKYLALPFMALVIFDIFGGSNLENQGFIGSLVSIIIYIYLDLNLAFITHKITLNKQSEISIIDGLIWRKKHTPFIKAFLVLSLIAFLMIIPMIILFSFMAFSDSGLFTEWSEPTISLILFTIALPFIYIFSRYSLIAPSAAANKPITLANSFSLSEGYGWVIASLTFIIPMLFGFISDKIPFTLSTILTNISIAFSIILLTNCYKYIKKARVRATTVS